MKDLIWTPAWQVRERIVAGEISTVEVIEAALACNDPALSAQVRPLRHKPRQVS